MESNNQNSSAINADWKISRVPMEKHPKETKIKIFENMISTSFSKCKPFLHENGNTKWWKINNHHLLKKVLFYCRLSDIVPYESSLYNSYYQYGYYVTGIKSYNNTQYFIYGIPGLYGIDVKPHFANCCWKSENNSGELYGEFGYWLVENEINL